MNGGAVVSTHIPHSKKDVGSIPNWGLCGDLLSWYYCRIISPTACSQHGDVSMAKTPNPQNAPETTASVCDCKCE